MARARKYTAEFLAPIVASSRSIMEVARRAGVPPNGGNHRNISAAIRRAKLDTSHFGSKFKAPIHALTREELHDIVKRCDSYAEILRALDLPQHGNAFRVLNERIETLQLDTSHMRRELWSKGHTAATHPALKRQSERTRIPDDEFFVENGPYANGHRIAGRLLALGWSYCCAKCGIKEWCGARLVLHVDHINGINNDNRLENLRFLCPNCHSQTDTYCARNRGRASRASDSWFPCYTGWAIASVL